jgi:CHASE3 domain sensor protein
MTDDSLRKHEDLLEELADVTELINVRNKKASQLIETSAQTLGQSAQQLVGSGERLAEDALNIIRTQGGQAFLAGAGPALDTLQRQIQGTMGLVGQLDQALAEHRHGVRGMIRNALIVLALGALAAVGVAAYMTMHVHQEIVRSEWVGQINTAIANGKLVACHDGGLCAYIGKKLVRLDQ